MATQMWKLVRGGNERALMVVGTTYTNSMAPLQLSGGALSFATDHTNVFCVGIPPAASGDFVPCIIGSDAVFEAVAESAVNFKIGDPIYMAENGTIGTGTQSLVSSGVVVDYDPLTASLVHFKFLPGAGNPTTHA